MPQVLQDTRSVPKATEAEWELGKASIKRPASVIAIDPRTTPEIPAAQRKIAKAGTKFLSAIIEDLNDLVENPIVDEDGRQVDTTPDAYKLCCDLLINAAILDALARAVSPDNSGSAFCVAIPEAVVSPDECGGIRVEWVRDNASVHLVVPANKKSEAYIYTEVGNVYGTEAATAELLAESLRNIDNPA